MQNINKFTEVYIFVPSITIRRKLPYMESRVKEIDYLKCIFITLMIIFHLVYIGDKYPYAKQIVYTFHMSAFLIISGYLANNRKDARSFLRKFLWIFIPYACMEAAYTVMSHFLPVRESVDAITPTVLLDKIFLHPMGPYWYLHTLILCSLIYYITFRYVRLSVVSRLVVTGVCLFALSHWGGLMNFSNALYFLIGMTHGICCPALLNSWIKKYSNLAEELSLPSEQESPDMSNRSKEAYKDENAQLKKRIKELEKALSFSKLETEARELMITRAEELFNIPIRKKSGAKS